MSQDPPSKMPEALLWKYELQREKRSLTEHMIEAKHQIEETEDLVTRLSRCLKDLTVIVASVATSLNDQTPQGQQRLRLLQTQLHEIVDPLYQDGKTIVNRNESLLAAIATLRGIHNTPNVVDTTITSRTPPGLSRPKGLAKPSTDPNRERPASSPLTQALLTISRSQTDQNQTKETEPSLADKHAIAQILSRESFSKSVEKVIRQRGRPIGEYFDAAHDFRRRWSISIHGSGPTSTNNDSYIIETFIEGLDSALYQRRFTHWLRHEHWTWNFVFHFAQILVMEEEYMAKQEYALDHKLEDGSVLFPDGERSYRFSYLPPITDEDLTSISDRIPKTRQQLFQPGGAQKQSLVQLLTSTIRQHGVRTLYTGSGVFCASNASKSAIRFFTFDTGS
ncbi:hypothetical protein N7481_012109 [Penicillium waksmanii]|uniref:uncharacterized protein n=1 Tax=Penicillium waksmanii TaxID=69791 RepID=UPI00254811AF|nr:uncharacterized protein N7481_012109 [Penicillium waksmanii]KAJ5965395.1 hypothetical protein N7481_012109 [Penicillium waksmanii]